MRLAIGDTQPHLCPYSMCVYLCVPVCSQTNYADSTTENVVLLPNHHGELFWISWCVFSILNIWMLLCSLDNFDIKKIDYYQHSFFAWQTQILISIRNLQMFVCVGFVSFNPFELIFDTLVQPLKVFTNNPSTTISDICNSMF